MSLPMRYFYLDCAQETLMVALYIVGAIVCVRNRRVSRYLLLVIAGFAGLIAAAPMVQLVGLMLSTIKKLDTRVAENFFDIMQCVGLCQRLGKVLGLSLVVIGLGLVLIDIGRRIGGRPRKFEELNRLASARLTQGVHDAHRELSKL